MGSSLQQACNTTTKCSLELLWSRVGNEGSQRSGKSLRADRTRHSLVQHDGSTTASQGRDADVALGSAAAGRQSACKPLVWQQVHLVNTAYLQGVPLLRSGGGFLWLSGMFHEAWCFEVCGSKGDKFCSLLVCAQHHRCVSHPSISHQE